MISYQFWLLMVSLWFNSLPVWADISPPDTTRCIIIFALIGSLFMLVRSIILG